MRWQSGYGCQGGVAAESLSREKEREIERDRERERIREMWERTFTGERFETGMVEASFNSIT